MAFTQVKRVDEIVSEKELAAFIEVVELLPNHKVPVIPSPFAYPQPWDPTRTLLVSQLAEEELARVEKTWSPAKLAEKFAQNRVLKAAANKANLTLPQFFGLQLALVAAHARNLQGERDGLDQVKDRGEKVLSKLMGDSRQFSTLSPDVTYELGRQGNWIPLLVAAKKMSDVPLENRELVQKNRERIEKIFPAELVADPLLSYAETLNISGLPFHEVAASGFDEQLRHEPAEEHHSLQESNPVPK